MMWSMSCLILLPRNRRRIQCLKALDLMLGTDSSSSMWSVSLVSFFLVEEKEELDAWKLERKLGFTVLTNFFLGFNAQFLIFAPQRRKEESVSIGLKRKNQELSIESNLFYLKQILHPPTWQPENLHTWWGIEIPSTPQLARVFFWFWGSKKEALCTHTHTHQGFCGGRILWAEKLALVCKERDEEEEGKGKKNQRLENKTQTNVMSTCKKKEEEEED